MNHHFQNPEGLPRHPRLCPGGTPDISRWQAPRGHRLAHHFNSPAPEAAVEYFTMSNDSRTPAGVQMIHAGSPVAALRLPPANIRQPSGLPRRLSLRPGGTPDISRWQAPRGHRLAHHFNSPAPEATVEYFTMTNDSRTPAGVQMIRGGSPVANAVRPPVHPRYNIFRPGRGGGTKSVPNIITLCPPP